MAPKKATTTPASKKATTSTHPAYKDMIKDAIVKLKERTGSSRQAIKKYLRSNYDLGATSDAAFDKHVSQALANGEKAGDFNRPKGPSGPVKLAKKEAAPKAPAPAKPATTTKKPATKPAAKPAASKTTTAKTTTKKPAATKKAATTTKTKTSKTTTKANSAKKTAPKKPAAAPAVPEEKPTVLTKTKTGRVVKTTKPETTKKAAATKKTATKKSTPKKSATPKKAEAAA